MMPDMEPAIIPYVDQHTGPKRVLDLNLRRGMVSGSGVEVSIDGRAYPVDWGRSLFEIPADRPGPRRSGAWAVSSC